MELAPWHVARDELLAAVSPLPAESIDALTAVHRTAATVAVAPRPVPPRPVAAMDGVAVRSIDTPGRLPLLGDRAAGDGPATTVPGTAQHVSTGALLPEGSDAVARREIVEQVAGAVDVPAVARGTDVRLPGSQLPAGEPLLQPGELVRASHLALFALTGLERIEVHRRPVVGLLVTGAEVVRHADGGPGLVRDAIGPVLQQRLTELGADVRDLGLGEDDPTTIAERLRSAAEESDLLVVTGGTSVGRHDHLAEALRRTGTATPWRLALRPAKPLVTGAVEDVPVIGLPGNPDAARVSFELLVRPVVRRLAGGAPDAGWWDAELTAAVEHRNDGRVHVHAGRRDGTAPQRVDPLGRAALGTLARADTLLLIPDGPGSDARASVRALDLVGLV